MFFRAFYAVRPLTSTKGVPVNAVYGFISMIVKLMKEKKPDHMVFCYDRKEPSFRKNLYTEYKANRSEMPEDLQVQMPYLKQVAQLFGICDLEFPGYEADDLIGTVARISRHEGVEAYIVSGDKDFCQLVGPQVYLYDTMKDLIFDSAMVKEKHGVTPDQFIDYLAITGDTSDNIPGVAGIGPKGAQKLIEQFGHLENVYEHLDEVSSASIRQKLIDSKEKALLSKKLVTIVCDVPIEKHFDDFKMQPLKKDELRAFFKELNFKTFEKNLLGEEMSSENAIVISDQPIEAPSEVQKSVMAQESEQTKSEPADVFLRDWSTDVLQKKIDQAEPFFIFLRDSKIAIGFGSELYVADIPHCRLNFSKVTWSGFDLKKVWTELGIHRDILAAASLKVDWDLMLGAYVLRAADSSQLEKLVSYFLKKDFSNHESLTESEQWIDIYRSILQLNQVVQTEIHAKDLRIIYNKLEKPIVSILYKMEKKGITLDLAFLKQYSTELAADLAHQESKIHELAGEAFNVASPKQLGVILFEKLGLEVIKKTKTGYSTDNDVLEKLNHPIAQEIILYRELAKLKSTYVDSLPELADQQGRVHTHFNQALTATGRFSSTHPNLQNIPIKTERGQKVRRAFIAASGKKLLSVDYSQIELRVLAHMSNDPGLIKAFTED